MSFEIVFRGKLIGEVTREQAIVRLAKLFKTEPARVAKLFSGQRVTLKKGLDRETADKYRTVLRKAGMAVSIVSVEPPAAAPAPVPEAPPPIKEVPAPEPSGHGRAVFAVDDPDSAAPDPAPSAPARAEAVASDAGADTEMLAAPGATIIEAQSAPPAQIDTSSLSMGEVGEIVDDRPRPARKEIDTSALSASDIEGNLDDAPRPDAPEIDTSSLSASDDVDRLDDSAPPPPPDIDISGLSDAPVDGGLDDRPKPAAPAIDISGLSLGE